MRAWVLAGLLLALLGVVAGAAAALVRWRRARRARRAARRAPPRTLRYPLVLAPGVLGFDEVEVRGKRHEYFRGVAARLRALGAPVHVVRVPGTGSVAARAEALARAVRSLGAERVNIVAHSMGGLDARWALARLGLAAQVASLTTIGTPHRGTPLADAGTRLLGDRLGLKHVARALALDPAAFYEMTTRRMAAFNGEVPDAAGVAYASYVGALAERGDALHPLLVPSWLYLARCAGPNDGLVPADSQRWGEVLGTLEADHWAQIGWSSRFDAPGFYLALAARLAERGL